MKVGLLLSFENNTMDGKFYYSLFEKFVKFPPYSFVKGVKGFPWNTIRHIKEIKTSEKGASISIFDLNDNIFSVNETGTRVPHQSVCLEQDSIFFCPTNAEIENIIVGSNSFVSSFLYNYEYTLVQSSESETLLAHRNLSKEILDTIKNTPYKLGVFDKKDYEIRFNPGKQILLQYTWLLAAWKMWFGKPFFDLVSKKHLLAFPYATEVRELINGQVYIQLFDKIEDSHTPESMFRQWKWQEWIDYDRLLEKYS